MYTRAANSRHTSVNALTHTRREREREGAAQTNTGRDGGDDGLVWLCARTTFTQEQCQMTGLAKAAAIPVLP